MPGMKTDESVALKFSVSFYAISDCTAFHDIFRNKPYFVYFVLHRLYVSMRWRRATCWYRICKFKFP